MSLIDDLLDRWEEMRECGQKIAPEQLCIDHPELLPEVLRQINALEAVSLQFGSHGMENQSTAGESDWSPASHFELLNRFEIIKLHASGGLGHVYLAHDKVLDRPVAIKFLKRAELTSEQLARFEWEAKITGKLEHPGIVPIHSMQESKNSTPCYVMRFIKGLTLQQRVETIWGSDPAGPSAGYFRSEQLRDLLRSFAAVCNIVAYAHAQGVLHRDIKPGNIMLGPFGETLLLDWGIAKPLSDDSNSQSHPLPRSLQSVPTDPAHLRCIGGIYSPAFTATGQAIGTPAYASPEQLQGLEVASQPTTDVFSLGATLHYILSCKSPIEFFGWSSYLDQFSVTDSMLAANLSYRVPRALRAICHKALRTQPQDRYQSALELAEDIQNFLSLEPVSVLPEPWHARLARLARKRPALTGSLIASMIVVLIATLISSALLRANNLRLAIATVSLNQSLEKTNFANRQTIDSLRQMFEDVVIHYFGQHDILNDQDRRYLSKLAARYELFANQQEDGIQNCTTRAEANYRLGRLYYHLQMADRNALNYAHTATQLYSTLCHRDKQYQLVCDYLESLRLLSEIQIEQAEDVDGAMKTIELCLSERARFAEQIEPKFVAQWSEVQASLHAIQASCHVAKSEWSEAFKFAKQAATDYEMLVDTQPDEHRFLHKLAGVGYWPINWSRKKQGMPRDWCFPYGTRK